VAGGVAAGVLLTQPAAQPPVTGPPLNNPGVGAIGSPASSASAAPVVPVTVRLLVPTVGIDIPVIQGDGVHIPLFEAMHYPGTAQPGAGSSSLFYAHGQKGMFYGLYSAKLGDEIRAVRADGSVVRYTVHSIVQVPWNDLSVLKPTPYEQIILLTCTSYDPYTPRLLIIGTPS